MLVRVITKGSDAYVIKNIGYKDDLELVAFKYDSYKIPFNTKTRWDINVLLADGYKFNDDRLLEPEKKSSARGDTDLLIYKYR